MNASQCYAIDTLPILVTWHNFDIHVLHNTETQKDLWVFYCKGYGKMCSEGINEDREIARFEARISWIWSRIVNYLLALLDLMTVFKYNCPRSLMQYSVVGGHRDTFVFAWNTLTYLPIYLSLDVENVEEHLNPRKLGSQCERCEVLHVTYRQGCTDLIRHVEGRLAGTQKWRPIVFTLREHITSNISSYCGMLLLWWWESGKVRFWENTKYS